MNSSFNASTQQKSFNHAQQLQHITNTITTKTNLHQSPQSVTAITYLHQPQTDEMNPQQIGTILPDSQSAAAPVFDSHHLQLSTNLEKSFYNGATSVASDTTPSTTASGKSYSQNETDIAAVQSSSVLITNNFGQQSLHQSCPTISAVSSTNVSFIPTTTNTIQQSPPGQHHVYNINNNICKESASLHANNVLHISQLPETPQHQQLYQNQHQMLQPQSFSHQPLPTLLQQNTLLQTHIAEQPSMQLQLSSAQQYFVPTETAIATSQKIIPDILPGTLSSLPNSIDMSCDATTSASKANSSTVVLDSINICINNHYSDNGVSSSPAATLLTSTTSSNEQQPSPIIPLIQHKAAVDTPCNTLINSCSNNEPDIVIDEPDSTTTPNTPPTTPESNLVLSISETLSNNNEELTKPFIKNCDDVKQDTQLFLCDAESKKSACSFREFQISNNCTSQTTESEPHAPLTPPTPTKTFTIGEDVFIKRQDDRFYLGTIIDSARLQFLVRFDDKSEVWCESDKMRKLGGQNETNKDQRQMCVACKRDQHEDIVEICERCGRGYHRKCTTETTPGLGQWLCKRCRKPMKIYRFVRDEPTDSTVCRQLPYHANKLHWDKNHRVNEEQIYCYCGKPGKFDQNMLQCCMCRNWFHTSCLQNCKFNILRGDGFFVFCCSICNDGKEFLRRLQINWVDMVHLTLYNLSALKKHQHIKYHHLYKDIMPFILEKRCVFPIQEEWMKMTQDELMGKVIITLKENTDRFICGRELKRDNSYFALRNNGPPILPKICIESTDELNDNFLVKDLKLVLLKQTLEKSFSKEYMASKCSTDDLTERIKKNDYKDVYEFRIDDDDTSDDEIPIKHMIDNIKKSKLLVNSVESPNSIDNREKSLCDTKGDSRTSRKLTGKCEDKQNSTKQCLSAMEKLNGSQVDNLASGFTVEKSSRKRKAFTLSKSYKELTAETSTKRYDICRIGDSSSDENSSSSRGTSLDVIIPPPKNFLGQNNPFRMITPKKNVDSSGKKSMNFGRSGTTVKRSIFNTTALDLGEKLAALKSAGVFPNVNTSHLAKAAGQPRTVRTIKRRLSAKDITIGPNQEVRRRRIRRLSSNVEVISTTTINPIPSTLFQVHAKDLKQSSNNKISQHNFNRSSSASSSPPTSTTSSLDSLPRNQMEETPQSLLKPTHGRRLRQRPQKNSPSVSRRSSVSSGSTSSSHSNSINMCTVQTALKPSVNDASMHDLKESVNKYFGAANRFESGEPFTVVAKRILNNGETQYLIEWGDPEIQSNSTLLKFSNLVVNTDVQ